MSQENKVAYDQDFYAWCLNQVQLMKEGKLEELDIKNLIEEVESVANKESKDARRYLGKIIYKLLRYSFKRNEEERPFIEHCLFFDRIMLKDILKDSPSLPPLDLEKAYSNVKITYRLNLKDDKCPFTLEQCLDLEFFPELKTDKAGR